MNPRPTKNANPDAESARERAKELKALFAETQALPQADLITDEIIAAEIDAYRAEEKAKNMPKIVNPKSKIDNRKFTTQSSLDSYVWGICNILRILDDTETQDTGRAGIKVRAAVARVCA